MRGAARSGRGSHLSHGRPGREVEDGRLADDDTDKRREEGMVGVPDEEVLDDDTDERGEEGMVGVALGAPFRARRGRDGCES